MSQSTVTIVEWITAIGSIITPLFVLILTAFGWRVKNDIERRAKQEEALRDDRIAIYDKVLEPFIIMFSKDEAITQNKLYRGKDKPTVLKEKIVSIDFQQASFKLALTGSDGVVRAFNELMQAFYKGDISKQTEKDSTKFMRLVGNLLVEIRRSVGNEHTQIGNMEILEFFISDIRKHQKNGKY